MEKKFITLCADDYGLNYGVSKGILALVEAKKLSAVSCLVNFPALQSNASALLSCDSLFSIGLHFNLTEGCFLSKKNQNMPSLKALMFKSNFYRLAPEVIEQELIAQIERFRATFKRNPDFIDGHQHVHQFPQIQDIVLKVYNDYFPEKNVWMRSTYPYLKTGQGDMKAKILAYFGARKFKQKLVENYIPHPPSFTGFYDFSPQADYSSLFSNWIQKAPNYTLIMCHPGFADKDAISQARQQELAFLRHADFTNTYSLKLSTGPQLGT